MREGWLEETPDGRVLDWFTGVEQRWDFGMGQWVAVPEPTEGIKVFIASNPDGTFQELGGITGITFSGNEDDDDFGGETISTLRTGTFRVTFEDVNESMAEMVNSRKARESVFDDRLKDLRFKGWPEPTYPKLTERQMSPSVYTPQPEDPLFTSEEIEKAAQHLGVELLPWQKEMLGRVPRKGQIGIVKSRRQGWNTWRAVKDKALEIKGATASEPIYDEVYRTSFDRVRGMYGKDADNTWTETSTEAKKLSKKERIAELEQTVEALLTNTKSWESDYKELESEVDEANKSILILERELDDLRNVESKLDTQLEINHTLKQRITNQRTELRRLNESLRTKSLEAKMLGLRVKILGKEKGHLVGSSESKQRTIESQQEIIDGLRAQLAKKPWWRS